MKSSTREKMLAGICITGILLVLQCAAPRTINQSGRVTPPGQLRVGAGMSGNISAQTMALLFDGLSDKIESQLTQDTIVVDGEQGDMTKALLSYSLDPLSLGSQWSLRYGLFPRLDLGFASAGGVKLFDTRYQFMGPADRDGTSDGSRWYGSVGVQYSAQTYTLPSYLGDLQELLGYEMSRKDILVPLVFSREFGPNEKYGAFGTGLAWNYSMVRYRYAPDPGLFFRIVSSVYEPVNAVPQDEVSYSSFGAFCNVKAGYKFIYTVLSLSVFYQNFGEYNLLAGETAALSGVTVVPALDIQFTRDIFDLGQWLVLLFK